jgi:hypothetical protein
MVRGEVRPRGRLKEIEEIAMLKVPEGTRRGDCNVWRRMGQMEAKDRGDLNRSVSLFEMHFSFWMGMYGLRVIINSYKHTAMSNI